MIKKSQQASSETLKMNQKREKKKQGEAKGSEQKARDGGL